MKLLDIKGDAIKGKSILDLTFNKNVIGDLFSFFYLFNGNNFYNLTSTVLTKYSNSTSKLIILILLIYLKEHII